MGKKRKRGTWSMEYVLDTNECVEDLSNYGFNYIYK